MMVLDTAPCSAISGSPAACGLNTYT